MKSPRLIIPADTLDPKDRRKFPMHLTRNGILPILLSPTDAAHCIGISPSMMYSMIRNHELPPGSVRFVRGKTRIVYSVLKNWYEQQAA